MREEGVGKGKRREEEGVQGPGKDLSIGLKVQRRWCGPETETVQWGQADSWSGPRCQQSLRAPWCPHRGLQPHTWVKVAGCQGDFEQGVTRTGSWACSFALTQATRMPAWHIAGSSVSKSSLAWKNAGWAVGKFTEYLASILAATVSSSFPAKLASGQGCLRPLCSDCSCTPHDFPLLRPTLVSGRTVIPACSPSAPLWSIVLPAVLRSSSSGTSSFPRTPKLVQLWLEARA